MPDHTDAHGRGWRCSSVHHDPSRSWIEAWWPSSGHVLSMPYVVKRVSGGAWVIAFVYAGGTEDPVAGPFPDRETAMLSYDLFVVTE